MELQPDNVLANIHNCTPEALDFIEKWFDETGEFCGLYVNGFGVTRQPEGDEQGDGEFCNQFMSGEDSGSGVYYYPIEDSTEYVYVAYCF